jgi:hypothetical protein
MVFSVVGNVPPNPWSLYFEWCTDSGAYGSSNVAVNANESGTLEGINVNLSMAGMQSSGVFWGSQDVDVWGASAGVVNQMYVEGASIVFNGGDPSCTYYVSYENADNLCNPMGAVNDECVSGC